MEWAEGGGQVEGGERRGGAEPDMLSADVE